MAAKILALVFLLVFGLMICGGIYRNDYPLLIVGIVLIGVAAIIQDK